MTRPASTTSARAVVPFAKMKPAEQVSELFYNAAVEVTKPAYLAISRAYPTEMRREDHKIEYRYQEAYRQAKQHLNFYKRAVREFIDDFVAVKKHTRPYDATEDVPTKELRGLLDTQLLFLYKRLDSYAELLVPASDVESYRSVLSGRFEIERKALAEIILPYEATPKITSED